MTQGPTKHHTPWPSDAVVPITNIYTLRGTVRQSQSKDPFDGNYDSTFVEAILAAAGLANKVCTCICHTATRKNGIPLGLPCWRWTYKRT